MKFLISLSLFIILFGCQAEEKSTGIRDISITSDELIDGLDEELEQEIVDYAFLPEEDTLTLDSLISN